MNFNDYSRVTSRERELEMSKVLPMLMRKVYTWMAMALAITGVVAYGVGTSENMMMMLYTSRMPLIVAGLAELGIVFYVSARINRLSLVAATSWFIVFSILNGLTSGGYSLPSQWHPSPRPSSSPQEPSAQWPDRGHYQARPVPNGQHHVYGTHRPDYSIVGQPLPTKHYDGLYRQRYRCPDIHGTDRLGCAGYQATAGNGP